MNEAKDNKGGRVPLGFIRPGGDTAAFANMLYDKMIVLGWRPPLGHDAFANFERLRERGELVDEEPSASD